MKTQARFILAAVIMMMVAPAHAQSNMGIKGGVNFYNLYYPDNSSYSVQPGFHAGLLWHVHLDNVFAIQPEVMYSLQGAETGNASVHLGYLNVPCLLQLMFNNGFRLEAGPQLGFLVHGRADYGGYSEDIRPELEPFDTGLAFGFGFIGHSGWGFDARYIYGLTDIDRSPDELRNRGIQLGLFYQFNH